VSSAGASGIFHLRSVDLMHSATLGIGKVSSSMVTLRNEPLVVTKKRIAI
jgi:hypothetical protein